MYVSKLIFKFTKKQFKYAFSFDQHFQKWELICVSFPKFAEIQTAKDYKILIPCRVTRPAW